MRAHLNQPLTVAALARQANLTERTLIRQFRATTGTTPLNWLNEQRVQRARELLESGTLPIDQVGHASGLGGPANFRRHIALATGVSPSTYRRTFSSGPRASGPRASGPRASGPRA
jgi:AraC family transcriptional activator FtrA